jgi:Fe-S-cluster containining protein
MNLMEYGNIFYQDGLQLAREKLDSRPASEAIMEIMESVYGSIDGLIESFSGRCEKEGLRVDCRMGCVWCCSQAVLASTHEIMYLFTWMEKNLSPDIIKKIRDRAEERNKQTVGMSAMEFLHFTHPCPFLEEGSCLIYHARPMACRIYLSSSENSCKQQYDKPDDPDVMASLYEFPLHAGRLINEGIRKALAEKGIIPSEWLIESLLNQVFKSRRILAGWIDDYKAYKIRELSREEKLYLRNYQESQVSSGDGSTQLGG